MIDHNIINPAIVKQFTEAEIKAELSSRKVKNESHSFIQLYAIEQAYNV